MRIWQSVAALAAAVGVTVVGANYLGRGSGSAAFAPTQPVPAAAAPVVPGAAERSTHRSRRAPGADTFHGYVCTIDCSGHEAGYNWAEEHGVTDPDECPIDPHDSHSFTEGCWAFAGRDGPSSDEPAEAN
jgi:hypothetical protein